MVMEELANESVSVFGNLIGELGKIALWLQAVGVVIVLWIIFDIINVTLNFKRRKYLKKIDSKLKDIDLKVNRLLKIKEKEFYFFIPFSSFSCAFLSYFFLLAMNPEI
jgi:hypothetical protein